MRKQSYKKIIAILILIFSINAFAIRMISSQQLPLEPLMVEDADIIIDKITLNKQGVPIFSFYSKLFKVCENTNICGPGNQNNFVPVRAIIIFRGEKSSRNDKASIMWEVRFKDLAPVKLVYGEKPFNARQIVAPKTLKAGETYTICLYPKESVLNCTKWVYDNK